jgi:energy-coupling factor transport system ATP-binding protein
LDVSKVKIKELAQRVGYVFQYPEHQFLTDTVHDEMAFGLKGMTIPAEEIEQRTSEMLNRFSLDHVRERHPLSLSRGQKRRLSVASMLVMRPEIFILDEPTTGQDRKNIDEVMQYLVELNKAGLTIIIVTHDMELVAAYADRVLVMEKGSVAYEGTPWQLFDDQLATQDKWGLSVPEGYRIYQLARDKFPWLTPELVPEKLASYLEEGTVN